MKSHKVILTLAEVIPNFSHTRNPSSLIWWIAVRARVRNSKKKAMNNQTEIISQKKGIFKKH